MEALARRTSVPPIATRKWPFYNRKSSYFRGNFPLSLHFQRIIRKEIGIFIAICSMKSIIFVQHFHKQMHLLVHFGLNSVAVWTEFSRILDWIRSHFGLNSVAFWRRATGGLNLRTQLRHSYIPRIVSENIRISIQIDEFCTKNDQIYLLKWWFLHKRPGVYWEPMHPRRRKVL